LRRWLLPKTASAVRNCLLRRSSLHMAGYSSRSAKPPRRGVCS